MVTALWRFMGEGWARWVVCSAILIGAYVIIGRVGIGPQAHRPKELSLCGMKTQGAREQGNKGTRKLSAEATR